MLFLEESGIVAQVSEPLTDASTSTFYISTFFYDHLLVCTSRDQLINIVEYHKHSCRSHPFLFRFQA